MADEKAASRCVYCGSTTTLTRDHIPPKSVFGHACDKLITVPACLACNKTFSKDDEYFRFALSMSDETGANPSAMAARQTALRSLTRPKAGRYTKRVLDATDWYELRSQSGLILGKRMGYAVEMDRIFEVVKRIIRGLYFHESGRMLSRGSEIIVHGNDTLNSLPQPDRDIIVETIAKPLANRVVHIVDADTFMYRFQILDEDPNLSAWALTFYRNIPFLGVTYPEVRRITGRT